MRQTFRDMVLGKSGLYRARYLTAEYLYVDLQVNYQNVQQQLLCVGLVWIDWDIFTCERSVPVSALPARSRGTLEDSRNTRLVQAEETARTQKIGVWVSLTAIFLRNVPPAFEARRAVTGAAAPKVDTVQALADAMPMMAKRRAADAAAAEEKRKMVERSPALFITALADIQPLGVPRLRHAWAGSVPGCIPAASGRVGLGYSAKNSRFAEHSWTTTVIAMILKERDLCANKHVVSDDSVASFPPLFSSMTLQPQ